MVDVYYEPRKKVIIHEYIKYDSPEDLAKSQFITAPPGSFVGPLKWAAGIVMNFSALPLNSETVIKELIDGTLHWDHVAFAPMKEPKNIRLEDKTCLVIDVSNNPTFLAIAEFIKKEFLDKKVR